MERSTDLGGARPSKRGTPEHGLGPGQISVPGVAHRPTRGRQEIGLCRSPSTTVTGGIVAVRRRVSHLILSRQSEVAECRDRRRTNPKDGGCKPPIRYGWPSPQRDQSAPKRRKQAHRCKRTGRFAANNLGVLVPVRLFERFAAVRCHSSYPLLCDRLYAEAILSRRRRLKPDRPSQYRALPA